MQVVRTIVWVLITALLVAFIAMNWGRAHVNVWPTADGYLYFEWPVGFIALVFFALGWLPMWAIHRVARWRLTRKLSNREASLAQATAPATPPITPSPLDTTP